MNESPPGFTRVDRPAPAATRVWRSRVAPCLLAASLVLSGCEKTFENMYDQPKHKPLAQSALWADGRASRPPPLDSVARAAGTLAGSSSGRLGTLADAPR